MWFRLSATTLCGSATQRRNTTTETYARDTQRLISSSRTMFTRSQTCACKRLFSVSHGRGKNYRCRNTSEGAKNIYRFGRSPAPIGAFLSERPQRTISIVNASCYYYHYSSYYYDCCYYCANDNKDYDLRFYHIVSHDLMLHNFISDQVRP